MRLQAVCLMQGKKLRESKKGKKGDFTQFVKCKVFFESEFGGFEVYCSRALPESSSDSYWLEGKGEKEAFVQVKLSTYSSNCLKNFDVFKKAMLRHSCAVTIFDTVESK